ncbi:hypothetical protein CJP74_07795 [Psittacicella melopsittaci]|uniref:Uncharacterized protein n=1 Tax=Psittacicella melopsittaci TaxID=2028576 RepID=A0A3A1XZ22_9GAMM|nr:hypothetical protein [Psittacicella melopsittaci]RIY31233.1 hypothetical protein CJP74_07795 [Psittacicella melopsittaci]
MKLKSVLLSTLVAATAFVSINANASTKDPATAYSSYYAQAQQANQVNNNAKVITIDGVEYQGKVIKGANGFLNVLVDGERSLDTRSYTFAKGQVRVPASFTEAQINQALQALDIDTKVSTLSYFQIQNILNSKSNS